MDKLGEIREKVAANERLTFDELLYLSKDVELLELAKLSAVVRERFNGKNVYYNHNFHIEPTNICVYNCKFCSFKKLATSKDAWCMTESEVIDYAEAHFDEKTTEIHLVGGVNPRQTLYDYVSVIKKLREKFPKVGIKAFSAIEHIYMIEKANLSYDEGVKLLVEAGMDSITGGGAEIFAKRVREKICNDKPDSKKWLSLHEAAHKQGVKTNATMLYGHIETLEERIDHILQIRDLQDKYNGFNSFIPLKYRSFGNSLGSIGECSLVEDLKTVAISRLALDNVPHIKAYYPMYGKQRTEMALNFGADDLDGTPIESTKIYSMAGVSDNSITVEEIDDLIKKAGYIPVERDTFYNRVVLVSP
ncbi:MAG: CofH family radical SAM protein [Rikenellaceae bacterium]